MQVLDPAGHWSLVTFDLAITREEAALERQSRHLSVLVNSGPNGKQAIGSPRTLSSGRVAAADRDLSRRALNNLKMVRYNSTGFKV